MENTLEQQVEKLQAFKDYVHKRLDDYGIEKEPKGEHSEHGCRIGDRLDIVLNEIKPNNGWISIESEEDLPKDNGLQYHTSKKSIVSKKALSYDDLLTYYKYGIITHYQPIQKPKPPIF